MGISYDASIVIAAHGSEAAADSNHPVIDLANQIGSLGIFADVTPAFLLGDPLMEDVLSRTSADKVVVVPLMTSDGYYLNSVIPKKLSANQEATKKDWFVSSVAGMHPRISELMIQRVRSQFARLEIVENETTIVLVGHGTRKNRNSAKSAFRLFAELKAAFSDARVRVAFLDQDPEAHLVAASVLEGHTIVVPFLVSRGPHTTVDVPEAFGLESGAHVQFPVSKSVKTRGGLRKTICIEPLALYPEMSEICVELAIEAIEKNQRLTLPTLETA